jgi:hypothetical protein
MGRGMGLSKANIFTGKVSPKPGMLGGLMTQKGLLPLAATSVAMGAQGVATDAAGGGGRLIDKAFGQNS